MIGCLKLKKSFGIVGNYCLAGTKILKTVGANLLKGRDAKLKGLHFKVAWPPVKQNGG